MLRLGCCCCAAAAAEASGDVDATAAAQKAKAEAETAAHEAAVAAAAAAKAKQDEMARVADEKRTANEEVARLVPDMGADTVAIQIDNHGSVSLSMPRAVWQRDPSGAAAAIWKDMTEEQKKTGKTQLVAALATMSDEDSTAAIAAVPASDRAALEAMISKARHKRSCNLVKLSVWDLVRQRSSCGDWLLSLHTKPRSTSLPTEGSRGCQGQLSSRENAIALQYSAQKSEMRGGVSKSTSHPQTMMWSHPTYVIPHALSNYFSWIFVVLVS